MAVETMLYIFLGIFAKIRLTVMKLVQHEYIDRAHALGIVSATITVKMSPNTPSGERMAWRRPPTLVPLLYPAFQCGTEEAEEANEAPMECIIAWIDCYRIS